MLKAPPVPAAVISIRELKSRCSNCSMRELCLSVGLDAEALHELDSAITQRLRLRKGETLYRAGDAFKSLYAVKLGSCKITVQTEDGREQIIGYRLTGDMLGFDGIDGGHHGAEAIALEDSEVCVLPFEHLEEIARALPALQHNLHQFMSRTIGREQSMMLTLGRLRAEERLAVFLLSLSDRYHQRGYSSTEFVLRMTREEIGSYLGLKLETVSRLFSRFQQEGLLQVQGRNVKLFDLAALRQLAGLHC